MIRFDAIRIMRRWGSLRRCALSSADTLTACLLTALRLAYEQHIHMPDKPREMSTCARTKLGASLFGLSPSHLSAYESRRRALLGTQPQLRERCPFAAACASSRREPTDTALPSVPLRLPLRALRSRQTCAIWLPPRQSCSSSSTTTTPHSAPCSWGNKDFRCLRQAATLFFPMLSESEYPWGSYPEAFPSTPSTSS